jgi:hypothetical protein
MGSWKSPKRQSGLMNISFLAFRNVRGDGQLGKMPMLVPFNEIKGVHFLIRNTLLQDRYCLDGEPDTSCLANFRLSPWGALRTLHTALERLFSGIHFGMDERAIQLAKKRFCRIIKT